MKLSDTLRYYMRDTAAAKDLLYRRTRALADYEAANKALEKARTKNKDVPQVCLFSISMKMLMCVCVHVYVCVCVCDVFCVFFFF